VSVPAREQRVLDEIEAMLQAGEARLASMFALFARLARDEGVPGTEDLGTRSRPHRWLARLQATALYLRDASRWSRLAGQRGTGRPGMPSLAIALLPLAAAAMVATVLLGVSMTSVPACGPVPAVHGSGSALSRYASAQEHGDCR
jgi:hypothetical protein